LGAVVKTYCKQNLNLGEEVHVGLHA
jgi:hypothetical protein